MIRNEYVTEQRGQMRGGDGTVTIKNWVSGGEKPANVRLAGVLELPVGASIGTHRHEGEAEIFHVISGEAEYSDNGRNVKVGAGDVMICYSGEEHSVKNTGDDTLLINAVIVTG